MPNNPNNLLEFKRPGTEPTPESLEADKRLKDAGEVLDAKVKETLEKIKGEHWHAPASSEHAERAESIIGIEKPEVELGVHADDDHVVEAMIADLEQSTDKTATLNEWMKRVENKKTTPNDAIEALRGLDKAA